MTAVPYRGSCANYMCVLYGCQGHCGYRPAPTYSPGFYQATPAPRGCVCPPESEKTCQGFGCPRKSMVPAAGIEARKGGDAKQGSTRSVKARSRKGAAQKDTPHD